MTSFVSAITKFMTNSECKTSEQISRDFLYSKLEYIFSLLLLSHTRTPSIGKVACDHKYVQQNCNGEVRLILGKVVKKSPVRFYILCFLKISII
jgi:hypothetical protein